VGEFSLPRRGGVGAARGGSVWECGDEVATRRCVPGALGRLVEVWYASWLLVASLGDGVLTWMPCGVW